MWELDYKESRAPKNWCFWTAVLEKTFESSLDCKDIQPIHPKEISHEYSLDGLMLKLKLKYFGHLMWWANSLEKTLTLGRVRARGEGGRQGMRWLGHHWLEGQTPGDSEGQGSLGCCSPWGCHWTQLSDWTTTTTTKLWSSTVQDISGVPLTIAETVFWKEVVEIQLGVLPKMR